MILFNSMRCLAKLEDDQYKKTKITHTRIITRAIILNDKDEICLLHLLGDDLFGHRDYYETPGGGIKENETLEEALLREIKEETGIDCDIISPIGFVDDYYNAIYRHNMNYYYLCKAKSYGKPSLEDYEKTIINGMIFVNIDEAIKIYENMNKEKIEILVSRRELPVLRKVKEMLEKKDA